MLSVTDGTTEIGVIERISDREVEAFLVQPNGSTVSVGKMPTLAKAMALIRERRTIGSLISPEAHLET